MMEGAVRRIDFAAHSSPKLELEPRTSVLPPVILSLEDRLASSSPATQSLCLIVCAKSWSARATVVLAEENGDMRCRCCGWAM